MSNIDIVKLLLQNFTVLLYIQQKIDFVHGDIKLNNIFCSGELKNDIFRLKIADLDKASSTFTYYGKYYRFMNRNDKCFMFKNYIYKKYIHNNGYYYFKAKNFIFLTCIIRHTINNINFGKAVDIIFCFINYFINLQCKEFIIEKFLEECHLLFKKKRGNKIIDLTDKELITYINKFYELLNNSMSLSKTFKLLNYKKYVLCYDANKVIIKILNKLYKMMILKQPLYFILNETKKLITI